MSAMAISTVSGQGRHDQRDDTQREKDRQENGKGRDLGMMGTERANETQESFLATTSRLHRGQLTCLCVRHVSPTTSSVSPATMQKIATSQAGT